MSKKDGMKHRARYALEFKLEAVRLVKAGQEASVTARVLRVPKACVFRSNVTSDSGQRDRPVGIRRRNGCCA
jgi:hypothetical protein